MANLFKTPTANGLRDNHGRGGYVRYVRKKIGSRAADGEPGGVAGAPDDPLFKPTERFYLNADSPVPLYHQMEKIILDRISAAGVVGGRLPREMDLVEIFGVSRITVKKVTDSLAARGLIRRRRAVGTHIVSLGVTEDLGRLTSFTEQMASRGLHVSTEILGVGLHVPNSNTSEKLQLKPGEKALFIQRLRGTSEIFPVVFLQSEIPARFGISPDEDFCGSLYQLLENKYRIPIEWAEEQISASQASTEEAKHLKIKRGDVVLVMERQTFTSGNSPLEFVRAVYRPEHYTFSVRLRR
jgi:GntR family transcriptional regulator